MAWLTRPLLRRPLIFLLGMGSAAAAGLLFQPHWVDFCTRINSRSFVGWNGQEITRGGECAYVSQTAMVGNFLIGFGVLTMIIGPIVFSIAHVLRHGYNHEYSRVETAVSNLPILSGIIYVVIGGSLSFLAYS